MAAVPPQNPSPVGSRALLLMMMMVMPAVECESVGIGMAVVTGPDGEVSKIVGVACREWWVTGGALMSW